MYLESPVWPITKEGGTISAFGSLSVNFWPDVFTCTTEYDRIKITVIGGDNNGFQISAIEYFDIIYSGA